MYVKIRISEKEKTPLRRAPMKENSEEKKNYERSYNRPVLAHSKLYSKSREGKKKHWNAQHGNVAFIKIAKEFQYGHGLNCVVLTRCEFCF